MVSMRNLSALGEFSRRKSISLCACRFLKAMGSLDITLKVPREQSIMAPPISKDAGLT